MRALPVAGFVALAALTSVAACASCTRDAQRVAPRDADADAVAPPHAGTDVADTATSDARDEAATAATTEHDVEVAEIPTLVTSSGPPTHVRLVVRPRLAAPAHVHVGGVVHRAGPARRGVTIVGLAADGAPVPVGAVVVAPPGRGTELVVSFAEGPEPLATADAYPFTVALRVDGAPRAVDVTVRRAERRRVP